MPGLRTSQTSLFGGSDTGPVVRGLLLCIGGIWAANFILSIVLNNDNLLNVLELRPSMVVKQFALWQLATYMVVHPLRNPLALLFNLFNLWMFGRELESLWGSRRFLQYFLLCGVVGGLTSVLLAYLLGRTEIAIVGASGAILGLIMAFGLLFPELPVLFFGLFPIKMKWLAIVMIALAVLIGGELAMLGGLAAGYFWLQSQGISAAAPSGSKRRVGISLFERWKQQYEEYKFQRNKKKFQEYMKKHDRDRSA
jgi:membrane associated rhomboid family serine protease